MRKDSAYQSKKDSHPNSAGWFNGKTALVTGATSGIGREIAKQMACYGTRLLLCGRDKDEMKNLVNKLKASSVLECYLVDFSNNELLKEMVVNIKRKYEIDIIVNNAGFGYINEFYKMPREITDAMLNVNVIAMVEFCSVFLPFMVKKAGTGVLNVGSVASFFATPGSAIYGATKHFVLSFTDALHKEMIPFGVNITGVYPGHTHSRFIERATEGKKSCWDEGMEPAVVAELALEGLSKNRIRVIPGIINKLKVMISKFLPVSIILDKVYGSSANILRSDNKHAK